MKKFEKILLLVLLALLIGRMAGLPLTTVFFAIGSFILALAYLFWGYRLLRPTADTPAWTAITAGVAYSASMVVLPFATYARQDIVFKVLPALNGALLLFLLVRWGIKRKRQIDISRPLIIRSAILFGALGFLTYLPPIPIYRSVIITLNRGNERLIANMHMVGEFEAYEEAYEKGECEQAVIHAERANRQGRVWLFGPDHIEPEGKQTTIKMDLGDGMRFNLDSVIHAMQAEQQQAELWKISRTYDNLYNAHHCLAENAEGASDPETAYEHYYKADSVLNIIKEREGYWNEERAWSLYYLARSAATLGQYDLSDSLYDRSLNVYADIKDSLDADAAQILADWSRSLSTRQEWSYANYLIRAAIGYAEDDSTSKSRDTRWIQYRLQLVKNLIATDSIALAELTLAPCEGSTAADSSLRCETLLVKGALQFRKNEFRSADTTFKEAVECLTLLEHNEAAKAIAYLSWGHVKTALADYASARELVAKGQRSAAAIAPRTSINAGLLQLSALIHHLQGHYLTARREYEATLELLASSSSSAGRTPGAMAGMADLLLDLAEPLKASVLADSALAMLVDSLPAIIPSQASVLNTAANADYYLNDLESAEHRYSISINACQRYDATSTTTYAQALNGQGLVAMSRSRYVTADSLLAQAYSACAAIYNQEHPFTARVLINQAELRLRQRRLPEARTLLLRALPTTEKILGKDHDQLADIHQALGELDLRSNNHAEASLHFQEALRIYKVCFPAEHPKVRALQRR